MRPSTALAAVLTDVGSLLPGAVPADADPRVHTYSIVARDPRTGEMGIAVQSHWFSVGSIVTWADAGVGVVATQSLVDPAYGPKGLALMRQGVPAPKALAQLVAADPGRNGRQVAMVDATGAVDAYTGSHAIVPDQGAAEVAPERTEPSSETTKRSRSVATSTTASPTARRSLSKASGDRSTRAVSPHAVRRSTRTIGPARCTWTIVAGKPGVPLDAGSMATEWGRT